MYAEPIYKGATRPAMKLGIPLVPLVVLFGTGMLLVLWGGTLISWWLALAVIVAIVPALVWMRWITTRDDQRFRQMFVAVKLRQPFESSLQQKQHRMDLTIEAMDRLSAREESVGRTYALTDPDPPTVRELVETFARILGKRVVWVPLPTRVTRAALGTVPGLERLLGLPAEAIEYSTSPTTYSTANTVADLEGTGVRCPRFADYAERLLQFMITHPEIDSKAMA